MKRIKNSPLAHKTGRVLRGRSSGLTLIEIVIAITLIGILAVSFLGGLSNAIYSLHIADVRTTAESLARSEMERVKEARYEAYTPADPPPYSNPGEESSVYGGYYVLITAFPVDPDTRSLLVDPDTGEFLEETDSDLGLQEITVTVSHHDRGHIITITGYKVKR